MRGQLTGLWRAADSQPLPWQNPQRFGWSVWESGVPTGVRQQGSGAAGLPRRGFLTQVHVYAHHHRSLLHGRDAERGPPLLLPRTMEKTPTSRHSLGCPWG